MMKQVLITLLLSASTFALATPAFAQTSNPDTTETDQSEEDWRKSKKKGGSSDDIIDIIKNTRSTGVGNGRGYSPIDSLPEESRRHLMKERAKRMAEAGVGEPVDVTYKPSPGAQGDPNLEADEKAAWEEMSRGMNGADPSDQGTGGGQGGQPGQMGQSQQGQQGQSGQAGQMGQMGQQGTSGGSSSDGQAQGNSRSPSVMRGGSSASVADILSQIKGGGRAPSGTQSGGGSAPQGQMQQGQSQQGQAPSGSMSDGQSQAHGQAHAQNQSQNQSQAQNQADGQNTSQNQSDAAQQAQSQADAAQQAAAAQAQAQQAAEAQAEAAAQQAQNQRTPEPISPLDRLKDSRQERAATGSRSSASDYLKKKD